MVLLSLRARASNAEDLGRGCPRADGGWEGCVVQGIESGMGSSPREWGSMDSGASEACVGIVRANFETRGWRGKGGASNRGRQSSGSRHVFASIWEGASYHCIWLYLVQTWI